MKVNLFGQEIERKYLMIAVGVILILGVGYINHSNQTKHLEKYENNKSNNNSNHNSNKIQNDNIEESNIYGIDENYFAFESTNNDKEIDGVITQTNIEKTIHYFDLKNNKIRLKTFILDKMIQYEYNIKDYYLQEGLAAKTHVFVIEDLGVKEIWISFDVPNLGYDYDDGSRIACYDLKRID
jgi:hypothetical protein